MALQDELRTPGGQGFDEYPYGFDEGGEGFDQYTIGEYFQAMNLLQSEINARIETANRIDDDIATWLAMQEEELRKGWFLTLTKREDYLDELFDLYMLWVLEDDEYTRAKAGRWAVEVETTTENAVKAFPELINPERKERLYDLPESVQRVFSQERALRIALTETNAIHNYDRHLTLAKEQATHTWESMKDDRVRFNHELADGQTVLITEPFTVGGQKLMFPGDDSLGATAENLIGCRCLEV